MARMIKLVLVFVFCLGGAVLAGCGGVEPDIDRVSQPMVQQSQFAADKCDACINACKTNQCQRKCYTDGNPPPCDSSAMSM